MSMYSNRPQPALQNLLQCVVWFFHPRSSCTMTHISADVQRITLNALCMTISGGRTKQLDIFCHVTGFTSDFLSFIVVELIQFFHRALHIYMTLHNSAPRPVYKGKWSHIWGCQFSTFQQKWQHQMFRVEFV